MISSKKNNDSLILNKGVSFLDKKEEGVCAVFLNYQFYFFENRTRKWFLEIVRDGFKKVPKSFASFLKKDKILISSPDFV